MSLEMLKQSNSELVSPTEAENICSSSQRRYVRRSKSTCNLGDVGPRAAQRNRPLATVSDLSSFVLGLNVRDPSAPRLPSKDGYLWKMSADRLVGWQKRWIVLKDKRLCYYHSALSPHPAGVIDFDLVKITIQRMWNTESESKSNTAGLAELSNDPFMQTPLHAVADSSSSVVKVFACCCGGRDRPTVTSPDSLVRLRLKPEGSKRVFEFSGAVWQMEEWAALITKHIAAASQIGDPLMIARQKRFWAVDRIPPYKFREVADSGDVILFRTKMTVSRIQRAFTRAEYDHVGMVIKRADGLIFLLEALGDSGVCLTDWRKFVDKGWINQYKKITIRRVSFDRSEERMKDLLDFCYKHVGKPYGLNMGKLMRSRSLEGEPADFFCSELVGQAWKTLGILQKDKGACSQLWPGSFAQGSDGQLCLTEGVSVGNELMIDFLLDS